MSIVEERTVTRTEIEVFEKMVAQMDGLHQEVSVASRKAPNDAINVFKLSLVNEILRRCNELLGGANRPFAEFEQLSSDELPSNSDVVFILGQYIACAEEVRASNIQAWGDNWYWVVEGVAPREQGVRIETGAPRKLRGR